MSTEDETSIGEFRKKFIDLLALGIENQKDEIDQKILFKGTKANSRIDELPQKLHDVCALVVKIVLANNHQGDHLGIGSGIVIKQDEASFSILTCRHVVREYFDSKEDIKVVFTAVGEHVENNYIYDVSSIDLLCPSSDYLELNIKTGFDADIAILKCLQKPDVPIKSVVSIPLISDFEEKEKVYYIGYQNGSDLKWSSDYPVIRLGALLDATQKEDLNPSSDQQIISKYIQDDLMMTTIDTGAGCSGGGYFKRDGTFTALHIGKIKNIWNDSLRPAEDFELHLAVFPQAQFVHKDWFEYLDLEKKPEIRNNVKMNFVRLDFLEETNYLAITCPINCLDQYGKVLGRLITKEEAKANEYRSLDHCYQKSLDGGVLVPIVKGTSTIEIGMIPTSEASKRAPGIKNWCWEKVSRELQPKDLLPPHLFIVDLQSNIIMPPDFADNQLAEQLFYRFRQKETKGKKKSVTFNGYFYHHLTISESKERDTKTYFFAFHADNEEFLFVCGIGKHRKNRTDSYEIPINERNMITNVKDITASFGPTKFSRNQLNQWIIDL